MYNAMKLGGCLQKGAFFAHQRPAINGRTAEPAPKRLRGDLVYPWVGRSPV